jgi:hypothetical protein
MSAKEQLSYQRKVILEEYHEHLALQKRELNHGKNTFVRPVSDVQARERGSEERV